MAIIELQETHRATPAATLCDVGADTLRGTKPAAWVAIAIKAIGTCTPDEFGRMLHARVRFAIPGAQVNGKRHRIVDTWTPPGVPVNSPIEVSLDHGTGWIGTKAAVYLVGGTNGDKYDVTISENIPRDVVGRDIERDGVDFRRVVDVYEDPFRFRLTSYFVVPSPEGGGRGYVPFPEPPPYHQWFQVISGRAKLAMPDSAAIYLRRGAVVPLSCPRISVSTGCYLTKGRL